MEQFESLVSPYGWSKYNVNQDFDSEKSIWNIEVDGDEAKNICKLNSEDIKSPYDWGECNIKQKIYSEKTGWNIEFDLLNPSNNYAWRSNSKEGKTQNNMSPSDWSKYNVRQDFYSE